MTKIAYFPLQGGEDLMSPSLSVDPGRLVFSQNYECDEYGRYRRIQGHERFDGQPKPSAARYWTLRFDAGLVEIEVGNIVTGATASAEVLAVEATGTWGVDAAGTLYLTALTGSFIDDETLLVSGSGVATADGTAALGADKTMTQAAIVAARAKILAVPGSGPVRGGFVYGNDVYVFRDDTAAENCVLHKATAAGWDEVDLGRLIYFTGGATEPDEGDTLTGATSTATATIERVVVTAGLWDGTAAGYLIISNQVGTFEQESVTFANVIDDSVAITLLPGGRFECVEYNFYASTAGSRIYGCDGVNRAFEFDGTVFTPITTGMEEDAPNHVRAHKMHLFLSFRGGSLQHSDVGDPLGWITTSGEIGMGDEITGLESLPGGVLAVFAQNSTMMLYGSSGADWTPQPYDEIGAKEWSIQRMGSAIYLDEHGVTSLAAAQEYGDFNSNALSRDIQPLLNGTVASSLRVKNKSQYRLFFTSGMGINLTMHGGRVVGFTRLKYGMVCACAFAGEINGQEVLLAGDPAGMVYQIDSGVSLDGVGIDAKITTHYNHFKSPRAKKRFRKAILEVDAPTGATISYSAMFTSVFGVAVGVPSNFNLLSAGGVWNESAWDNFIWSVGSLGSAEGRITGHGLMLGMSIRTNEVYEEPHTLQGFLIHYSERGLQR